MKYIFFILIALFVSCSQQKINPAESALDAARGYKIACQQGNFEQAKFYLTESSKNNFYFIESEKEFRSLSDAQKRERYNSSLIIYSIKEETTSQSTVIVKDSYTKTMDTLHAVKKNNNWFIQLK